MEYWAKNCWKPKVKDPMLLVLDLHKAQKTDCIQELLTERCDTTPVFVPAGLTSILQPLDVSYNAPFKERVESFAAQHMQENLNQYLNGKFTAGERRVLLTKWVGDAWEELSKMKEIAYLRNVVFPPLLTALKILKSTWRVLKTTHLEWKRKTLIVMKATIC